MPIRVDLATKTVTLSPGALLAPTARRIGDGRGGSMERRWIGQAVHRRVLSEALASIPGYTVEKAVRHSFAVDGFTAVLEGRLDGRFEDPDGTVVVDEVKSVHFAEELPRLAGSPRMDRFARQLQWYLLAIARSEGRPVRGRLVLADIETGETKLVPVDWDEDEVAEDLHARVRALLEAFFDDLALAEAKASEAAALTFPFSRFRTGQREMAAAVARAVRQGEQLLVEAPTGIGKTAAALFPMLVEALRRGRKLYVLTSKTTQQEIFRKTLEAISAASASSVRLRAKERMCANGVVLCHEDHCAWAKDYAAKLEASRKSGKPLRVKAGFDPSAPDLHLGHTVVFRKMRHFQELGHEVIFLIGDFTGLIGDPTGKKTTRPQLTREEVDANAETYKAQVFKILDRETTVVDFNSRWLGALGADGLVRLAGRYTVAQLLERDDFAKRFKAGQPISVHELLYPLCQGYDSVALKADVELGGTDQLFNLLVGRELMRSYGLAPQCVMTTPLLVGLDGVEKMSKSLGNHVGVNEAPDEIFGKVMSVSDDMMWTWWTLLTDLLPHDIDALKAGVASGAKHPKRVKMDLALQLVTDFHGAEAAATAEAEFERRFAKAEGPVKADTVALPDPPPTDLASLLVAVGLAASKNVARQKVKEGAVATSEDGVTFAKAENPAEPFALEPGSARYVRLGKRFLRVAR